MSTRITERSLYPLVIEVLQETAERFGIEVSGVSEVSIGDRYPDIILNLDNYAILLQIKIDSSTKLIEDITKTYPIARKIGADLIAILLPTSVREIGLEAIRGVGRGLAIKRALVLTPWLSKDIMDATLEQLALELLTAFARYAKTRLPVVDFLTIARLSREVITELSSIVRAHSKLSAYRDMAQAIVGRFDFYRALLSDFVEEEEVMGTYVADIVAYIIVIELLFAHIASIKSYGASVLPLVENPLDPPRELIHELRTNIEGSGLIDMYARVLEALSHVLRTLEALDERDPRIRRTLARYIYAIRVLRPEHVEEELLGRIYQEGLPPETRKNLGAFFTHPRAAQLLAGLAVEGADEKVLDPACGSGTLLAAAYEAKMRYALRAGMDRHEAHRRFLNEDVVGIDIMQFAKELTSVNLIMQDIGVGNVRPRVFFGDGVRKMLSAIPVRPGDDPPSLEFVRAAVEAYERLALPREGFDVVIMNPPFTRRERIPEAVRSELKKSLGDVVRGKTGYWAYFFAAADNVVKPGGRIAAVTPEEFFAGRSAESLRRFLFSPSEKNYRYTVMYVVKSAADVAFSERTSYRDYLVVMKKIPLHEEPGPLIYVVLKKRKDELTHEDLEALIHRIKEAREGGVGREDELAYIAKIQRPDLVLEKHISNLKPLVGFLYPRAQELFIELLDILADKPSLGDLADIVVYNPGQHVADRRRFRGVEDYARRLFLVRYGARGKKAFRIVDERAHEVLVVPSKSKMRNSIDKAYLAPSLRSPAGVKLMDISACHEYAIIDERALSKRAWEQAGFVERGKLLEAVKDVRAAHDDKACRILIARRLRLTSPNIYWLAFYSDKPMLFTTSPFLGVRPKRMSGQGDALKALALSLNSSLTLLQLLGFFVETEGAFVTLHGELVWSHIRVPDIRGEDVREVLAGAFDRASERIAKHGVPSLFERLKHEDELQRAVDEAVIEAAGLEGCLSVDELQEAVYRELEMLRRVFESTRKPARPRVMRKPRATRTLERFFSSD